MKNIVLGIIISVLLISFGYCQADEALLQPEENFANVKPSGRNIVLSAKEFDPDAILRNVSSGMTHVDVIAAIGLPKEIQGENWYYTYEFPDKAGQDKWETLWIEFESNEVTDKFWLPHGSSTSRKDGSELLTTIP